MSSVSTGTGNIYDLCVSENLRQRPDAPAVVLGGQRWSYAELHRRCRLRAQTLEQAGIAASSVVGLACEDATELAVSALALAWIGSSILIMPRVLSREQREAWMALAGARVLVSDHSPDEVGPHCRCVQVALADEVDAVLDDRPSATVRDDHHLLLIGGSGSTGAQKLIVVTHGQLHHRLDAMIASLALSDADLAVSAFSLEYASGLHALLAILAAGGAFVIDWPDRDAVDSARRLRASVMIATAVHVEQFLAQALARGHPPWVFPDLRVLAVGGATVSDALRARMIKRLTSNLYVAWGSNECWYATVATPAMVASTPGTIGVAVPGSRVEVVSKDGTPVRPGGVGELRVASGSLATGYLGTDDAANATLRDGVFQSGDLGRLLDDGQIVFLGRKDNMMILNGVNIHPAEIERAAYAFQGVAEAFAFPMRHPVHQDIPCCAVAPVHPEEPFDLEALAEHLTQTLGFRRPRMTFLFDVLPRTAYGKISRREVTQSIRAGKARRSVHSP